MIRISNLTKSFGKNQVLKGIDLELVPGKIYGIVGENGAGKTTLFRCIAGFESHEGTVETSPANIKDHLGWLPTIPVFLSRITGWEYLKLLCVARGISTENFEEQNIFELPLHEYADHYSTGMKKKLALLGILLQKNSTFILDEPFNGVDIHSNMIISAILKELKAKNKLVLICSHIFSTLSENCDEIYLLKDGALAKRVEPQHFAALDNEMRAFAVGERLRNLRIE